MTDRQIRVTFIAVISMLWVIAPIVFGYKLAAFASEKVLFKDNFENGVDDKPAMWNSRGNSLWDSSAFRSGKRSIKIFKDKGQEESEWSSKLFDCTSQFIKVSGWMQGLRIYAPDPGYGIGLLVNFYDTKGQFMQTSEAFTSFSVPIGDRFYELKFPWKYFEGEIKVPGGAAKYELSFKFTGISPGSYGEGWLDDVMVTGEKNTDVKKGQNKLKYLKVRVRDGSKALNEEEWGTLFYPQEKINFKVKIPATDKKNVKLKYIILDSEENVILRNIVDTAPDTWQNVEVDSSIDLIDKYLKFKAEILSADETIGESRFVGFGVIPDIDKKYDFEDTPFAGMGCYITGDKPMRFARRIGMTTLRMDYIWGGMQPTPESTPDWQSKLFNYAVVMKLCEKYGIRVYSCSQWCETWADDPTMPKTNYSGKPELWYEWMKKCVSHYKDDIKVWQLGNEVYIGTPEERKIYKKLIQAYYKGVKEADPDAKVMFGSLNNVGFPEALEEGLMDYCDIVDFHYKGAEEVESMRESLRKKYPPDGKEIWLTEIGPNDWSRNSHDMAVMVQRQFISYIAAGAKKIMWCPFSPNGPGGDSEETEEYVLKNGTEIPRFAYITPYTDIPTEKYFAHYQMYSKLHLYKFSKKLNIGKNSVGFQFINGNKTIYVMWSKDDIGKNMEEVDIYLNNEKVKVSNYLGKDINMNTDQGKITLTLSFEPVYIEYDGAQEARFEPSPVYFMQDSVEISRGVNSSLKIFSGEYNGEFKIDLPCGAKADAEVKTADKNKNIEFKLWPESMEVTEYGRKSLKVYLISKKGSITGQIKVDLKLTEPVKVSIFTVPKTKKTYPQVGVSVKNSLDKEIKCELKLVSEVTDNFRPDIFTKNIKIPASKEGKFYFPCKGKVDFYHLYSNKVTLTGDAGATASDNSGFYGVIKAKKKPEIDGNLEEWGEALDVDMDQEWQFDNLGKACNLPFWKNSEWKGKNDLSGKARLMWDKDYLYFACRVLDDKHVNNSAGGLNWKGDSIQFALLTEVGSGAMYEWCFANDIKGDEILLGSIPQQIEITKVLDKGTVKFATKKVEGGLNYEVAIPWSMVPEIKPAIGKTIPCAVMINEDDGSGRYTWIQWFGGLATPTKGKKLFGRITFVDDNSNDSL